jgi:hypothetical protein
MDEKKNKITIMLGDKDAILELAQDPDVQIKVKDAIAAAAAKMAGKGINDALPDIIRKVAEKIDAEVLVRRTAYNYSLSDTYKKLIKDEVDKAVNKIITDAVEEAMQTYHDEITEKIERYKAYLDGRMEGIDIDSIVNSRVDKYLRDRVFISKK